MVRALPELCVMVPVYVLLVLNDNTLIATSIVQLFEEQLPLKTALSPEPGVEVATVPPQLDNAQLEAVLQLLFVAPVQ